MSDPHNLDFLGRRELLKLGAAGLGLGATSGLSPTPASADLDHQQPVSYTHLTLPTICSV